MLTRAIVKLVEQYVAPSGFGRQRGQQRVHSEVQARHVDEVARQVRGVRIRIPGAETHAAAVGLDVFGSEPKRPIMRERPQDRELKRVKVGVEVESLLI